MCTAPFIQGPRGNTEGWSGVYWFSGWFRTHARQGLLKASASSSIPGQKNCNLRNCLVLTILVSCDNLRTLFRSDNGTNLVPRVSFFCSWGRGERDPGNEVAMKQQFVSLAKSLLRQIILLWLSWMVSIYHRTTICRVELARLTLTTCYLLPHVG